MNNLEHTNQKSADGLLADTRQFVFQWGLAIAIGIVIFLAYFVFNTAAWGGKTVSIARWLMIYWNGDQDYSHGFMVPFITAGLLIYKWRQMPKPQNDASLLGLIALGVAMALYWAGVKAGPPHITAFSFVVLIFGLFLYFGGWKMTKAASFAIAFLLFMVPMRFFLDPIAFELRLVVSVVATVVLNILGINAVRTGTSINPVPEDPTAALEVADPCSGIRSLVMLTALASLYGYLTLNERWKKWLLFGIAAPLAVAANVVRITTIAMIGRAFGYGVALHVYHNWSGFIVFAFAVLALVSVSLLISVDYRQVVRRWATEPVPSRRRAVMRPPPDK